jgi:molybdopterin synthase catalytic subunit
MKPFGIVTDPIDAAALRARLSSSSAGAVVCFEGTVRDMHEGRAVAALGYEAYVELAEREGETIVAESPTLFAITHALAAHRIGTLAIGDVAVWVGVSAPHRAAAFEACRYLIDEIKVRVPIWKQERYADGVLEWRHPE